MCVDVSTECSVHCKEHYLESEMRVTNLLTVQ